jgi:hypothetical protein
MVLFKTNAIYPKYLLMKNNPRNVKKVDVLATASELAAILQQDPTLIEKDLVQRGDELLGIFSDDSFRDSFKNFRQMKIEALKMAIEDISAGAPTLMTSTIGLTFKNNKIVTYIVPFGTMASGNVLYSINLKDRAAFKSWRNEDAFDVSQDDVNTAIYRLTVSWSQLLT